jgi:SAM-dependent methyltransferase
MMPLTMNDDEFRLHPIQWDRQKVGRFWSYVAGNSALEANYFGHVVGRSVIRVVRRHVALRGRVVDYGCGSGMFMAHLFAAGVACEGVEFSTATSGALRERFAAQPLFSGVTVAEKLPTPLASDGADVVFFLETLEHLLPDEIKTAVGELHRLLKPGGHVVLTTPHAEDLYRNAVLCPDCGGVFHRWQHLSSFTQDGLRRLMEAASFQTVVCVTTQFSADSPLVRWLVIAAKRALGKPLPSLLYIGRK